MMSSSQTFLITQVLLYEKDDYFTGTVTTYTAEVFVQQLNVSMDDLQGQKLIVGGLHRAAKVKACIPGTQLSLL